MSTHSKHLVELIEQGAIPFDKINDALKVTKVLPDGKVWRTFIDQLLMWLGALAIAFSVLFFIAFNWDDLGRFAKFALVQFLTIGAILFYLSQDASKVSAKASLLAATLLVGVLLALYGQTYQTGADPWQLFFNWALLVLPWVLIGRFTVLWVVWLALINVAIVLYQQTFHSVLWMVVNEEVELLFLLFVLNAATLLIWELAATRFNWLAERWPARLLAVVSGTCITILAIYSIIDHHGNYGFIWLISMASLLYIYLKVHIDLFMIAGFCTSVITVVVVFLADNVLDNANEGGFLLLAMVTIGMGAGSAIWLRNLHREWQS